MAINKVQLTVNGENTYPHCGTECMMIECSQHNITRATAWTSVRITNMTVKTRIGNNLTLSNNGIRIGKGIDYISISACLNSGGSSAWGADHVIEVYKNSSSIGTAYGYKSPSQYWLSLSTNEIIIPVVEGDVIYLNCGGGYVGTFTVLNSYLTVRAISY